MSTLDTFKVLFADQKVEIRTDEHENLWFNLRNLGEKIGDKNYLRNIDTIRPRDQIIAKCYNKAGKMVDTTFLSECGTYEYLTMSRRQEASIFRYLIYDEITKLRRTVLKNIREIESLRSQELKLLNDHTRDIFSDLVNSDYCKNNSSTPDQYVDWCIAMYFARVKYNNAHSKFTKKDIPPGILGIMQQKTRLYYDENKYHEGKIYVEKELAEFHRGYCIKNGEARLDF